MRLTAEDHEAFILDCENVWIEMNAQVEQWGEQNHPDGTGTAYYDPDFTVPADMAKHFVKGVADRYRKACEQAAKTGAITWRHIMLEEMFEAMAEDDGEKLEKEIIQTLAVGFSWLAARDRRDARGLDAQGLHA